jgi:hypothetical protein
MPRVVFQTVSPTLDRSKAARASEPATIPIASNYLPINIRNACMSITKLCGTLLIMYTSVWLVAWVARYVVAAQTCSFIIPSVVLRAVWMLEDLGFGSVQSDLKLVLEGRYLQTYRHRHDYQKSGRYPTSCFLNPMSRRLN